MMTQPSILITGARGLVGSDVVRHLGPRAIPLTHADCDITDPRQIATCFDKWQPSAVINCAAKPNVDGCELEQEEAFLINGRAPGILAKACRTRQIPFLHFSTDYVFDGSGSVPFLETDTPNPLSVYGKSKLAGEEEVQTHCDDWIIARIQLMFGKARHNFVGDAAQKLRAGKEVRAFSDQIGSSSYSADIAAVAVQLLDSGQRGIFHIRNEGLANRVEVAEEVARLLHVCDPKIVPVSLKDVDLPAARPANCRLSIEKIRKIGIYPPSWQDAVARYLREAQLL